MDPGNQQLQGPRPFLCPWRILPVHCSRGRSGSKGVALRKRGAQITWTGYESKPSAGVRMNQDSSGQGPRSLCLLASQDQPHNSIASLIKTAPCLSGGLCLALGSLLGLCARSGLQSEVWRAILETEVMALGKEALAEGESRAGHRPPCGEGGPESQMRADRSWRTGRPQQAGWTHVRVCRAAQRALPAEKHVTKHRRLTSSWGGTAGH